MMLTGTLASSQTGSIVVDSQLFLDWCDNTNPLQMFVVDTVNSRVTSVDGTLCVTQEHYPAALSMQLCSPTSPLQHWDFNTSVPLAFTNSTLSDPSCLLWNTQGGPGYEMKGSCVGIYACSTPTPFDSVFALNFPSQGLLAAMYTSPNNQTFSNLCVSAVPPVTPPTPSSQQVAWLENPFACFVHFNMATAQVL